MSGTLRGHFSKHLIISNTSPKFYFQFISPELCLHARNGDGILEWRAESWIKGKWLVMEL